MAAIFLQEEPLDIKSLYNSIKSPEYGGIVSFCGLVREWTGEVQTTKIHYSAYEKMALKELKTLAETVEANNCKVVIAHRLGAVSLNEEVVFIGVACPHRKAAFAGCEFLIDEIKKKVPIWKKEFNTNGTKWGGKDQDVH